MDDCGCECCESMACACDDECGDGDTCNDCEYEDCENRGN